MNGMVKLRAAGTLAAGIGTAIGLVLIARGKPQYIYPFAIAAALGSAVLAAVHQLGEEPPRP
jgi:hypothetical protein